MARRSHENGTLSFPGAQVNEVGLRYVVDEDADSQELVPRQLLRVVPENVDATGEVLRSKAFVASYAQYHKPGNSPK